MIKFISEVVEINSWLIVQIPPHISKELPSRGMVMVQGAMNDASFKAPLEPDGKGSHWLRPDDALLDATGAAVGQSVSLSIEPLKDWSEPELPEDITAAFDMAGVLEQWQRITAKAKWEWLRWIRFTQNPETRQKRIDTACSMLQSGKKRPCCFDQTRCTLTHVSKNGVLLD